MEANMTAMAVSGLNEMILACEEGVARVRAEYSPDTGGPNHCDACGGELITNYIPLGLNTIFTPNSMPTAQAPDKGNWRHSISPRAKVTTPLKSCQPHPAAGRRLNATTNSHTPAAIR